jgi:hypothetical protein
MQRKRNETMKILLANRKLEMESQPTNSTFAIRTSQHSNPKLQKSYFFANAQLGIFVK